MSSDESLAELRTWGLEAERVEKIKHLLNPPACTACPFYSKIRGTHYCGVKVCHERKTEAWHANILQQASKNLGIAIYTKSDGRYLLLVSYEDKHRKLFEKRDPSLRLIAKAMAGERYHYQQFQGVEDDVFFVAATGDAIDKLASTGGKTGGGKKTEKEKAEMRAMKLYRSRRKVFLWEYTAAVQGMFENVPDPVLKKLRDWHFVGIDDRIPDEFHKDPNYQRRALVYTLIVDKTSHYRRESFAKVLVEFENLTQVKTPKALSARATEWDAEINAVATPVSAATPAKKGKKS